MGVQQYEMRRQMPREASRQPQGEVQGARNFVDDVNQQRRDERDELKRALEQSMVEELHRQKLEMEKQQEEMKKHAEDLQRQHDEMEKKNEELQKELKKDHAHTPIWHVLRCAGGDGLCPGGSDAATATGSRCDMQPGVEACGKTAYDGGRG